MKIARSNLPRVAAGAVALLGGFFLFQQFGNATRGYIDTHSLFYWWGYQWFDPASETQHGPLIVLAALGLLVRNLRQPVRLYPQSNDTVVAVIAMSLALALHVGAFGMQQTRLSILALLLFIWGAFSLLGGKRWGAAALFPVAFLSLAIPVGFLQPLSFHLRLGVSEATEALLHGAGSLVVRSGTQLFAPDGGFQYDVAAACSGIRSLVALVALSLFIGYLRLERLRHRVVLVLLVVPAAFIGNLARILLIVGVAQRFGTQAGERMHAWSGFLVFAVVLGFLLGAARLLERKRNSAAPPGADRENQALGNVVSSEGRGGLGLATVCLALALAAATWACSLLERRAPAAEAGVRMAENGIDPAPLPEFIGTEWIGQRIDVTAAEKDVLPPDTGYSRKNYVSVADREAQVFVSLVLSGRDRTSIHRPELCLAGQGFTVKDQAEAELTIGTARLPVTLLHVERLLPQNHGGARVWKGLLIYTFIGPQELVASHSAMIWKSSLDRLQHLRADRWAYLVVQTSAENNDEAALARIREVMLPIWPAIRGETTDERPRVDLK